MRLAELTDMANTTHNVASTVAKVSTYGGSAGAVLFGLTANDIAAFAGVGIGLTGIAITLFYKHREDRRAAQRHAAEMARLKWETDHHV
ncbi:holin [Stenotrophomonas sp. LARHCG68]